MGLNPLCVILDSLVKLREKNAEQLSQSCLDGRPDRI